MPIFRGVDISVVASAEAKSLPEYPHPDGSSVRLVLPDAARLGAPQGPRSSDASFLSDSDPTRQKKVQPVISVYIPSMPGEQFWLKYNVIRTPSPATHLYFKMYMNGALITSWGILVDVEETDQQLQTQRPICGTVVKALYEPGTRWYSMSTDTEGRMLGMETRYFYFMPGLDKRSVADDGGLIEIRVFRSKGRKRRAPKLSEFRNQERYGISSSSGGLVENPQDATYYDWLLIDPKDAPYASFRFHYRSMKHLLQLNLVPQSESRPKLPEIGSGFPVKPGSPARDRQTPDSRSPSTPHFSFGSESVPVFNDASPDSCDGTLGDKTTEGYSIDRPLEHFPTTPRSPLDRQQPNKTLRDSVFREIIERPLPSPPQPRSRHASQSSLYSVHSTCPSLTPSLANYVNDGKFGNDEISIGTAHTLLCSLPSMVELPRRTPENGEDDSMSDYEHSPPSSAASPSQGLPSPERYASTDDSVLGSQITHFTSPPILQPSPRRLRARFSASVSDSTMFSGCAVSSPATMSLSESEWMGHTPSPVQRKGLSRLWSPRLGRKPTGLSPTNKKHSSCYSDFGAYSSNESLGSDEHVQLHIQTRSTADSFEQEADDAVTPRAGNFPEDCQSTIGLESSAVDSHQQNTWKSCRELGDDEQGAVERPVGNWI